MNNSEPTSLGAIEHAPKDSTTLEAGAFYYGQLAQKLGRELQTGEVFLFATTVDPSTSARCELWIRGVLYDFFRPNIFELIRGQTPKDYWEFRVLYYNSKDGFPYLTGDRGWSCKMYQEAHQHYFYELPMDSSRMDYLFELITGYKKL